MTEDPRYPIGRLEPVGRALTGGERASRIAAIAAHPKRMREAVDGLSDEQLDTPYREGGWTVRQVVHHLADSHANAYVRFKLAVTEDDGVVGTYEETRWAELPDAKQGPVEDSLAILDALHRRWTSFLNALATEQWARTIRHPDWGDIPVDLLLEIYAWHGPHHEAHVTGLRRRMGW